MKKQNIVIIPGSLRENSYNKALAREIRNLAPEHMEIEILDISNIPFMNEDLENDGRPPQVVQKLKDEVLGADGVIFATPEYGNMVPGVLKNTFEWISRYESNALENKPMAIVGASASYFGTARAQNQLLLMGNIANMKVNNRLRIMVPMAQEKFDGDSLQLKDREIKKKIVEMLEAFSIFIKQS